MGENILWFMIGLASVVFPLALILVTVNRKPKAGLHFIVSLSNHIKISVLNMELKNTQYVNGVLSPVDAKGDPAQVQTGSVTVSSDDEGVATIEKDPDDETKVKVVGQRAGATVIRIKADADLGEGVKTIEAAIAVQVTSSEAVGLGVNFGEPLDQ